MKGKGACPFIKEACKGEECELFVVLQQECSFHFLATMLREINEKTHG